MSENDKKNEDTPLVERAFAEGGLVQAAFDKYEERPQQSDMAAAVAEAFAGGKDLFVEAGTGVGKSFAYLVPAIERASRNGEKVLISTYTITLQEQLVEKDIPFLQAALGEEFTAVLVKGRRNYLCRRRLDSVSAGSGHLFGTERAVKVLARLAAWSAKTGDGSLSDLSWQPPEDVWSKVCCEENNCLYKKCAYYEKCFLQWARRRMHSANLLIANHHLTASDIGLRLGGADFLPSYDVAVIDEAHSFEGVCAETLGINITRGRAEHFLNSLYSRKGFGFLAKYITGKTKGLVDRARSSTDLFFAEVARYAGKGKGRDLRVKEPGFVEDRLTGVLDDLYLSLLEIRGSIEDESDEAEATALLARCKGLSSSIGAFLSQSEDGYVYFIEVSEGGKTRVALRGAPLAVGGILKEGLYSRTESVVYTSATLAIGKEKSFEYFKDRLGLPGAAERALDSPFDYAKQVTVYVEAAMPDPRREDEYAEEVSRAVSKYVAQTDGAAFVLFTSKALMEKVRGNLVDFFDENSFNVLVQGGPLPRREMLSRFREQERAVIFGVNTFWSGVDVRGEALRNVIITRLPFPVPSHPVVEARSELIRARGGEPFIEMMLPEAVIRFRQGFGRLVRSSTDTGIVAVLDPRIVRSSYGRSFLESLPDCEVRIVSGGNSED